MFIGRFTKDRKLDFKTRLWIDGQLDFMNDNIYSLTANDKIELYDFLLNSSGECLDEFLLGIENRPRLKRHLQPLLLEVAYNRREFIEPESIECALSPIYLPPEFEPIKLETMIKNKPEENWVVKIFNNTIKFIRSKIVKM